jgi:hypothetical protein
MSVIREDVQHEMRELLKKREFELTELEFQASKTTRMQKPVPHAFQGQLNSVIKVQNDAELLFQKIEVFIEKVKQSKELNQILTQSQELS